MWHQVFSTGHAGSTWLSTVLDQRRHGAPAFHEPLPMLLPPAFRERHAFEDLGDPATRARFLPNLETYVTWRARRLERNRAVGEVHAFAWWLFPHLPEHVAPARCLVVRNGIQVVHSMSRTLDLWAFPETAFTTVLREPVPARGRTEAERFFELICAMWAAQDILLAPLAPLPLLRLEDLTRDAQLLRRFVAERTGVELGADELTSLQTGDRNKKVHGDRSPENLFWNVWGDVEREIFVERCGAAMARFGYAIPSATQAPLDPDRTAQRPPKPPSRMPAAYNQLWGLWTDPGPDPVVIVGCNTEGLTAAKILAQHIAAPIYLTDLDVARRGDRIEGFAVVPLDRLESLAPSAIYVAVLAELDAIRAQLARLVPDADVYHLFPGDTAMASEGHDRTGLRVESIERLGPIGQGDPLHASWRVERIEIHPRKVCIVIADGAGSEVVLDVSGAEGGAHAGPWDVRGGNISYRKTQVPYASFEPAGRALSERIAAALEGDTLAQRLPEWTRRG